MGIKSFFSILGFIALPILFTIVFFFSVRLDIYKFLKNYLSILDSYLLDQGLLLFTLLTVLFIYVIIKRKTILTYKNLFASVFVTLLFGGYFIFLLNFQSEILNRYFVKDDQFVLLPALLREDALDYRYSNKLDYFYYHFGFAVAMFKFFHLDAYYYNVFTLAGMALAAVILLKFLDYLVTMHNLQGIWSKFQIAIVTLLFITSPSIMDSFVYLEHSVATGYIVAGTILSIYFYILFIENRSKKIYFFLSFILMLFLLKTTLTRAGFLPAFLVLLEIFNALKNKKELELVILRSLLIFLPFFIIAQPYLSPPGSAGRLYGIGFERFINLDRIYLFFGNLIPVFFPFQFMSPFFRSIRILALGEFNTPTTNFILNHMLFTSGLIFIVFISVIIFILFIKRVDAKYILYFWLAYIGSLLFYMLFGNVIEKQLPPPHVFDLSLLSYGTVPGLRYYPLPLIFILATFYFTFISIINRFRQKAKNLTLSFTCFILTLIVWSNINFTQKVNRGANEGIITVKVITEKVLSIVPDNDEQKVIYSTGGRINDIEYIIRGFHGFFKYKAPEYFWQTEEMLKYLKENKIKKENLFAFYFDKKTLMVDDKTEKVRRQFRNYLLETNRTP